MMSAAKPSPPAPIMYTSNLLQTYPRVGVGGGGPGGHAGMPDSLYNPAAAAAAYATQGYMPFGPPDSSAFYSPLVRKDLPTSIIR